MYMLANFQHSIQKIVKIISILRPFAFLSTHPVILMMIEIKVPFFLARKKL